MGNLFRKDPDGKHAGEDFVLVLAALKCEAVTMSVTCVLESGIVQQMHILYFH